MRQYLLEALVSNYLRLVDLPESNFVLQKLCSTLVTFFTKPGSEWRFPLRHVFTCLLSGHYVPEGTLPEMQQLFEAAESYPAHRLKGVLLIATTMAEDLGSYSTTSTLEREFASYLTANCLDAWQLFQFCIMHAIMSGHLNNDDGSLSTINQEHREIKSPEILELLMRAMPYWASLIRHGNVHLDNDEFRKIEPIAKECIGASFRCLADDLFTGPVLQMAISLQQSSSKLLQEAIPNFPASIANSQTAKEIVSSLVDGDFSADGVLYVDLLESIMSRVDTTMPDFLHSGHYNTIVQTLQRLLRCTGWAVIEDPVCQIVLEKISEIVEGSNDWEEEDPARAFIAALAADACEACLLKIKLPLDQISSATQEWDADDRVKFQDFRYDVQDFFQSAFPVLGNALIEEIVKTTIFQADTPDWSTFEAGTFSLIAFSDTMSSDPDTYDGLITTVLGSQPWSYLLQTVSNVPDRVRQTSIRFITENVLYLQRHPDSLVLILNFLFSSLHLQSSASAASRAIYSLCDSHRGILREGLPQFMGSLATTGDLGEAERHRIYAAVAAIIQALPNEEDKIHPLSQLLASIGDRLRALNVDELDKEGLLRGYIDVMQTLASIGKGLRSPHDVPVDLEPSAKGNIEFWHSGAGAHVQHDVLGMYQANLVKVQRDADNVFIEACCDFLRSGFTEEHPSPFKFPDSTGLDLVSHLVNLENPSIDATMACASSFLASVDPTNLPSCVSGLLYPVVSNQQRILSIFHQTQELPNSTFPSASLDFLARLLPKSGNVWLSMQESSEMAATAMEMALIIMADPDTLPRRSAASFFAAFADFAGPPGSLDSEASGRVNSIIQRFGSQILSLLIRLLGGECARSEIESLTETLKRYVQKHSMLTKAVLREAVKQESGVMGEKALQATTLEYRNRFLSQVEGLRGARKTNDIVRDFWIACRGSGFGYIV